MICLMFWIDIKRQCKLTIALKTCAFLITLQSLLVVAFTEFGSVALSLLLDSLTLASDDDLVLARLVFFARLWEVTRCHVRMSTGAQFFATGLLAGLFTLATTVALLLAFVNATLQGAAADLATADFAEPARLILDDILATQTRLCRQVRAFGTVLFVTVTSMTNLRVTTALWPLAGESARRRSSTTRKRRLQHSAPATATDLVKDRISTSTARTFVAEFLTAMLRVAAFQLATAGARANVLCLKVVSRPLSC